MNRIKLAIGYLVILFFLGGCAAKNHKHASSPVPISNSSSSNVNVIGFQTKTLPMKHLGNPNRYWEVQVDFPALPAGHKINSVSITPAGGSVHITDNFAITISSINTSSNVLTFRVDRTDLPKTPTNGGVSFHITMVTSPSPLTTANMIVVGH